MRPFLFDFDIRCFMGEARADTASDVYFELGRQAMSRRDWASAVDQFEAAVRAEPSKPRNTVALAGVLAAQGRDVEAAQYLEALLQLNPDSADAWLNLGALRERLGTIGAVAAYYQALTRAQREGRWLDSSTTPAHLVPAVARAAEQLRQGRRELFMGSFDAVRSSHGALAVRRVEQAVAAYLHETELRPADPRQQPRFLFFPGLNQEPFMDPYLQPWAERLAEAYPVVKQEAVKAISEFNLESFIELKAGDDDSRYLGRETDDSAWDAYFFYRRGGRFDLHHAQCPQTSRLLESIDLCRIDHQAPEICFSLLRRGTHILPHFGVSNIRVVMHLPLVTPPDCALNLIGEPPHAWREGELVMFDDTFEHEAWNRSDQDRLILLMDCWNPHLTPAEREASKLLVETIAGLGGGSARK